MAKYGVIRTDNMHGTDVRAHGCKSIYFYNGSNKQAEIENGNVVLIGDPISGEREAVKATAVAKNSTLGKIAIVAGVEVNYDETKRGLDQYTNEAGKLTRAIILYSGDQFGLTKECLTGKESPAVGDSVELAAGTKFNITAAGSETQGATVIGKIDYKETAGKYTYFVITVA